MEPKIKLNWPEVRSDELTTEERLFILARLNNEASKYPKGFHISFPDDKEIQIIKFLEDEVDVVIDKFSLDVDTFTLGIYQNIDDLNIAVRNW